MEVLVYQKGRRIINFSPHKETVHPELLRPHEVCFDGYFNYPDYEGYHGPSNLAHIYAFVSDVNDIISRYSKVTVCTDETSPQCNNAICLVAFYLMLQECLSPDEAFEHVAHLPLQPFLGMGSPPDPQYGIALLDILKGFRIMLTAEPGILEDFDPNKYTEMEEPTKGDANWIIPGKILAMAGPKPIVFPPAKMLPFLNGLGVKTVIRLNRKHYSKEDIPGINHYDLFMKDGSNPSAVRLQQFLCIFREKMPQGAIAVHCRAGLGRTGSLICAYLMQTYGLTADQAIGFIRVMRPGSILCDQPAWLRSIEKSITPTKKKLAVVGRGAARAASRRLKVKIQ